MNALLNALCEYTKKNTKITINLFISGKLDEAKILIENGAIIDAHTNDGETPLDLALEKGRNKKVKSPIVIHTETFFSIAGHIKLIDYLKKIRKDRE